MSPETTNVVHRASLLIFFLASAACLQAQLQTAELCGVVSRSSGTPVADAQVIVKNVITGAAANVTTDTNGRYSTTNLTPGEYQVSVSALGLENKSSNVTIRAGATQSLNFALTVTPAAQAPSLSDLGFPSDQTKGSAQAQARLDKRSHMLKVHQRLGLITTIPLAATVITGNFAGGRSTSSTMRDVHAALGGTSGILYFTSAYYAIRAPKISGTATHGPIRLHKALAWIHGPGMVITPILGIMAFQQKNRGEKVHGIASAHGAAGYITAAAYGAAILSVSVKF